MSTRTAHLWFSAPSIEGQCDSCSKYHLLNELNIDHAAVFYVCDNCLPD